MAQAIEIDDEVYEQLKIAAEPFVDTPNTVLRRLLGLSAAPVGAALDAGGAVGVVVDAPAKRNRAVPKKKAAKGKPPSKARTRVPAGSILAEDEYEFPLLEALAEAGGEAPSREVTEAVGRKLAGRLTDLDREQLKSGGIRWENRIQFVRLKMIERGLMLKDTPRGIWALSDEGRRHVEQNR